MKNAIHYYKIINISQEDLSRWSFKMKTFTKIVVGLLVFNAIISNLRQEGVISGHISINYSKLIHKVSDITFIRLVDSDETRHYQPRQINRNYNNTNYELPVYYQQQPEVQLEEYFEDVPQEPNVHIISDGETLITLGAIYGVSWREIKEKNGIRNVRRLRPGQKIWIPTS